MTDFDPGPGWRATYSDDEAELMLYRKGGAAPIARWTRIEAVPPLPTEPYTVIRVAWKVGARADVLTLHPPQMLWVDGDGTAYEQAGTLLSASISGFKVLAEPTPRVALYEEQQRVARDILAVLEKHAPFTVGDLEELREKYGVAP